MKFAIEQDVDMIFASFIRRPEDVAEIRTVCEITDDDDVCGDDAIVLQTLGDAGKQIMIISKIENQQGMDVCLILRSACNTVFMTVIHVELL